MSDESAFSKVDDAVWAALKDTSSVPGNALRAWRSEQHRSGSWGKDFDTLFDTIPDPSEIRHTDSPALVVLTAGASSKQDVQPDYQSIDYPVVVLGYLRGRRQERGVSRKLKRFAELTWAVLAHHAAQCFGVSLVVNLARLDSIDWPDLRLEDELQFFTITITFEIALSTK